MAREKRLRRQRTLTHEIVLGAQQLLLPHHDPADRFLAATAQVWEANGG